MLVKGVTVIEKMDLSLMQTEELKLLQDFKLYTLAKRQKLVVDINNLQKVLSKTKGTLLIMEQQNWESVH